MNSASKTLQWLVWGGVVATIAAIAVIFFVQERRRQNPGSDLVQTIGSALTTNGTPSVLFEVPDFALTNQDGRIITRSNLLGQVWIADIIFTRCAGPCPEMTRRMAELQAAIPVSSPVRFVTLTTDPDYDTPAVMRAYARRFMAQSERWHFLTGTKRQIASLAVDGLKLTTIEKEPERRENLNDLFIHSTLFVLIDKRGRAREVFESDNALTNSKLLLSLAQLLKEE